MLKTYFSKFKGGSETPLRPRTLSHIFWSGLGAFLGIWIVGAITYRAGVPMMIGSFGASAVLIYAAIDSPLAQPRNLIGGHLVSAIFAVGVYQVMGKTDFSVAMAVSGAIAIMIVTGTVHPPGGATALIAVDAQQGFTFVLYPVLAGATILLIVALFVNNASKERIYPRRWL